MRRLPFRSSLILILCVAAAGCGGDDQQDAAGQANAEVAETIGSGPGDDERADGEAAETEGAAAELVEQADSGGLGVGTATVTINGESHEYRPFDGTAGVCRDYLGTLQVNLYAVDPVTGEVIDGPDLVVVLPQRVDGAPAELAPPSIEFTTLDGVQWAAGASGSADAFEIETPPLDLLGDGLTATGTFQVVEVLGEGRSAEATIDVRCE